MSRLDSPSSGPAYGVSVAERRGGQTDAVLTGIWTALKPQNGRYANRQMDVFWPAYHCCARFVTKL